MFIGSCEWEFLVGPVVIQALEGRGIGFRRDGRFCASIYFCGGYVGDELFRTDGSVI